MAFTNEVCTGQAWAERIYTTLVFATQKAELSICLRLGVAINALLTSSFPLQLVGKPLAASCRLQSPPKRLADLSFSPCAGTLTISIQSFVRWFSFSIIARTNRDQVRLICLTHPLIQGCVQSQIRSFDAALIVECDAVRLTHGG